MAGIVRAGGRKAIDAGSLKRARELKALVFLQPTLAVNEKISWTGGFGVNASKRQYGGWIYRVASST